MITISTHVVAGTYTHTRYEERKLT